MYRKTRNLRYDTSSSGEREQSVCLMAILKLIEADRLSPDGLVFSEKLLYSNFTVNARLAKVVNNYNWYFLLIKQSVFYVNR